MPLLNVNNMSRITCISSSTPLTRGVELYPPFFVFCFCFVVLQCCYCCILSNSVIFRVSMAFTTVMLVVERKKGLVERANVAGVNFSEVITAIIILQFLNLMIQIPCIIIIDIIKKVVLLLVLQCTSHDLTSFTCSSSLLISLSSGSLVLLQCYRDY